MKFLFNRCVVKIGNDGRRLAILTSSLARARSSSESDKSRPAHQPRHCTKPPIFGGMENPRA